MSKYNQWMNQSLYASAAKLSAEALTMNRGAFFGSILGTMNHIAVGDTFWLKRFAKHPACAESLAKIADAPTPVRLDETLFPDLRELKGYRDRVDAMIVKFAAALPEEALSQSLTYTNTKGIKATRNFYAVLLHFFNHQTHHRGQITALLFQAGIDPGTTDLLALIPQE